MARAFWAYFVALHLVCAILIFKTDFIPRVRRMAAANAVLAWFAPAHPVVLLGDSIMEGMPALPGSINLGMSGARTEHLIAALQSNVLVARASKIHLLIGVNDIAAGNAAGLEEAYRTILARLPPQVPLIWSGVMPADFGSINPAEIVKANASIVSLCSARPGCIYVDTVAIMAPSGKREQRFYKADGLHLSPDGYAAWIRALGR